MGEMERAVYAQVRRTKINRAIIGTLAVAGVLSVAVMAPNAPGAFARLGLLKSPQQRQKFKKSLDRLIAKGYVAVDGTSARLTQKGEKFAALLGEGKLAVKKPKRWDGKWRVLIFDIPERRRPARRQIRTTLSSLGFYRLQDSVWVYPYDCEDLIALLKFDLRLGRDVLYIIADKIELDRHLKQHFALL